VQIENARFEILELATRVKDQQTHEGIYAGVQCGGYHYAETLQKKSRLVEWTIIYFVQIIRLQRQQSARIGNIRQISDRYAERRQNYDEDKRK